MSVFSSSRFPCPEGDLILPLSFPQALSTEFRVHWRGGHAQSAQTGLRCSPGPMNSFFSWISFQSKGLRSLLQHHDSKAAILQCSAFFMVQLSHPYMTTGKTIALTRETFVGKVVSLLFNMRSRLVIAFLPRSKCLLISWLQSPPAVILKPLNIKSVTVSTVSPSICHLSDGTRGHDLSFLNVEL